MIRPRSQVRALVVALAMSVLTTVSVAGGVQAKPPMAVTFHASSDDTCVTGTSNRKHIRVELWRITYDPEYEQHFLDADADVTTHADHSYRACLDHSIKPGMALAAFDSNDHHVSWLIPTMKLRIDRVPDVLRGSIGAGLPSFALEPDYALKLRVFQCVIRIGGPCPRVVKRSITTDSTGHFRTDITHAYDLRGGDLVSLTYRSTSPTVAGNTYKLEQTAPFMQVVVGDKVITSFINPKQAATFRLRTETGGSLLSHVTATAGSDGRIGAAFSVYPAAPNEVSSDFASDARFVIPWPDTTYPIDSNGDQRIETFCLPGLPLSINWEGGGTGYAILTADSGGQATLDLAVYVEPGFHLAHGSIVRVWCITEAGDITGHGHVVP